MPIGKKTPTKKTPTHSTTASKPAGKKTAGKKPAPKGATQPRTTTPQGGNRFEVTGAIYAVMDAVEVSDNFTKREFVLDVTDNPKYPQLVLFQCSGRLIEDLDNCAAGDPVTVSFNLRGREWTNPEGEVKYFTTLTAWKLADADSTDVAEDDIPF
jgi:hypothetical protein